MAQKITTDHKASLWIFWGNLEVGTPIITHFYISSTLCGHPCFPRLSLKEVARNEDIWTAQLDLQYIYIYMYDVYDVCVYIYIYVHFSGIAAVRGGMHQNSALEKRRSFQSFGFLWNWGCLYFSNKP